MFFCFIFMPKMGTKERMHTQHNLADYLRLFGKLENPIYISIFILLLIILTIYFFIKYVLLPREKIHREERDKLEIKNLQLLSLFSEFSPDPLIRLDNNGNILQVNHAARILNPSSNLIGENISSLIPSINNSYKKTEFKESNLGFFKIGEKSFSAYIKNIPAMEMQLLYLRDITDSLDHEKKLKEITQRSIEDIEEERTRIAYELHDGIGSNLSLVRIKLFDLSKKYSSYINKEEFENVINLMDTSFNDLKTISYNLKPRVLDEMGLSPSIIELCNSLSKESGINISANITGKIVKLPGSTETSLYRISQEAINNVIKHAKATECSINIEFSSNKIKMIIADDGIGFNKKNYINNSKNKSLGLFNMKNRVENLNGIFKVNSQPGQGTIIFIEIPIEWDKNENEY